MLPSVYLDVAPITSLFTLPATHGVLDRLLDGFFIHLPNGGIGPLVLGIFHVAAIPSIIPETIGHGHETLLNCTLKMLAAIPSECGLALEAAQDPRELKAMLVMHTFHVPGPSGCCLFIIGELCATIVA